MKPCAHCIGAATHAPHRRRRGIVVVGRQVKREGSVAPHTLPSYHKIGGGGKNKKTKIVAIPTPSRRGNYNLSFGTNRQNQILLLHTNSQ